jgi:hypothetical protein
MQYPLLTIAALLAGLQAAAVLRSSATEPSHVAPGGASAQKAAVAPALKAAPASEPSAATPRDANRGNRRRQTQTISPTAMRAFGVAVGQGFTGWDTFLPKWYAAHPEVWVASDVANTAWADTSWGRINAFFATHWPENYYDYGSALTFDNEAVYLFGLRWASAAEYSQAARDLALRGLDRPDDKQPWLPLGIFALAANDQATVKVVVQLAVNKAGLVRGNYYRAVDKKNLLVQGSIYEETQRIAWIIGGNKDVVFDTGLYNLTRHETPVLIHSGPDETEQLLLVRMRRP